MPRFGRQPTARKRWCIADNSRARDPTSLSLEKLAPVVGA